MMNLSVCQLNSVTKTLIGKTTADLINERIILEANDSCWRRQIRLRILRGVGYEDRCRFLSGFQKPRAIHPMLSENNSHGGFALPNVHFASTLITGINCPSEGDGQLAYGWNDAAANNCRKWTRSNIHLYLYDSHNAVYTWVTGEEQGAKKRANNL